MRYFLEIAYDGTDFHGWQRQPNLKTIQSEIEDNFSTILRKRIVVVGCGRTDAGVHARQFFAHLDLEHQLDSQVLFRVNNMLPKSISILNHFQVEDRQHAQWDARARTYDYYIQMQKAPFHQKYAGRYYGNGLDIENMKKACDLLPRYEDFYSFCKRPDLYKHTLCKIFETSLSFSDEFPNIQFQIKANRFLQGMVRLLVARIMEVGSGSISLGEFEAYLKDKSPLKHKNPAYAQGLFLSKVEYDFLQ